MAVDTPPTRSGSEKSNLSGRKSPASPRLLDPHGIYGTRSANRLRSARRRRVFQNLALLALVTGIVAGAWAWQRMPRVPALSPQWKLTLAATPSASAATVSDGNRNFLLVPTESGRLVVVNVQDGTARDLAVSAFPLRSQPVVTGDTAFVPSEDGVLYAVNWKNGIVAWRFDGETSMTARPVLVQMTLPADTSAPTPANSSATSATPRPASKPVLVVIAANDEGVVTALRAGNGRPLWRRALGAPVGNALAVSNSGDTSRVMVPLLGGITTRGGLRCLDARNGRVLWQYPTDPKIYAAQLPAPAVESAGNNSNVYAVDDSGLVSCLDAATGRRLWKRFVVPLPSAPRDNLALLRCEPLWLMVNGQPRLLVAANDGGVRAFMARPTAQREPETVQQMTITRQLWSYDAGGAVRGGLTSLSPEGAARPLVAIGSDSRHLSIIDAVNGQQVARAPLSSNAGLGCSVVDNRLICLSNRAHVEAFDVSEWLAR
jgi:outer membrane protein assembly factor BamB